MMQKIVSKYWLYAIIVAASALWGCWWRIAPIITSTGRDYQSAGQMGDMFGSLNALFTCLAFCGLLYTITLQREELRTARENERDQELDSVFFKQLDSFSYSIDTLSSTIFSSEGTGNDLISFYVTAIEEKQLSNDADQIPNKDKDRCYKLNLSLQGDMQIIYKTLTSLLKLLDKSHTNLKHKELLIEMLRIRISPIESRLLYYITNCDWGVELKHYASKYSILNIYNDKNIITFYTLSEYKNIYENRRNDKNDPIRRYFRIG